MIPNVIASRVKVHGNVKKINYARILMIPTAIATCLLVHVRRRKHGFQVGARKQMEPSREPVEMDCYVKITEDVPQRIKFTYLDQIK